MNPYGTKEEQEEFQKQQEWEEANPLPESLEGRMVLLRPDLGYICDHPRRFHVGSVNGRKVNKVVVKTGTGEYVADVSSFHDEWFDDEVDAVKELLQKDLQAFPVAAGTAK
jgi:hypothetical protein